MLLCAALPAQSRAHEYAATGTIAHDHAQTASSTTVSHDDIVALPRRTAEDALRMIPGLTVVQHGSEGKGQQFFLRGFDAVHGADLEVTLEGIPLNEWSNAHAQGYLDLGIILPEVMRSVRATKGPYSIEQGAFAMAGSVAIDLGVAPEERGLRLGYTIGSTNRHRTVATYSPRAGDGSEFLAVEALHDDGYGQNRSIDRAVGMARAHLLDRGDHGRLTVMLAGQIARFALPGSLRNDDVQAGRVGFYDTYDDAGAGQSARQLLTLSYAQHERDSTLRAVVYTGLRQLQLLEDFTGFLYDADNGDRRRVNHAALNYGFNASHQVALTDAISLTTGLCLRGDQLVQSQQHVDRAEQVLGTERNLTGSQIDGCARSAVTYQPSPAFLLNIGARLDVLYLAARDHTLGDEPGDRALVVASPRMRAQWQVHRSTRVFAAYGRGFRPPEARAMTGWKPQNVGLNEDLYAGGPARNTLADSVELGARVRFKRWLSASATGFGTWIQRETIFDHVSGVNLELNATRRLGVELVVHARPTQWLRVDADVTAVDARFVQTRTPIPLAPWLSFNLRAFAGKHLGWRSALRVFGLAPRALPHGARGATYLQTDASLGYGWKRARLDLQVENLFATQLREGEYHYASDWRTGAPSSLPVLHTVAGPPLNVRLELSAYF